MKVFNQSLLLLIVSVFLLSSCKEQKYDSRMLSFFDKGNIQLKLDQYKKAIRYYSEGIKLDSSFADIFNNRGIVYFKLRVYEQAIKDYSKAIEINPDYTDAFLNRANAYFAKQNFEKAISDLDKVCQSQTYRDSAFVFLFRARAKMEIEAFDSAIKDINAYIDFDASNPTGYDSRGYLYIRTKKFDLAERDLKKAISLNETQDLAWANLGLIQIYKQNFEEAVKHLNKAVDITPSEVYSLNLRAFAFLELGLLERAKKDLEAIFQEEDNDAMAYLNQGIYKFKKGNFEKSLKNLQKAQSINSKSDFLNFYLANTLAKLGKKEKACKYWRLNASWRVEESQKSIKEYCQ